MQAPKIIILVLTFNAWSDTFECLSSLAAISYPNYQVVVVDNASNTPPPQSPSERFPDVHFIENTTNLGYAEGNNVGLRYALAQGAAYVLVLNNDTIVAHDVLRKLVNAAEQEPRAAFLGPLVMHYDEPNVIQSAGGCITKDWRSYHRGQNEPDAGLYVKTESVEWVSGCAIMARSSSLGKIGLIDPAFFIYSEEVDWCVRAREAGYQVVFVPTTKIWHKGVKRNYAPSPRVTYLSARNELLLLNKHHAGLYPYARTWLRHIRTLMSWSVRPRWRAQKLRRNALAAALRDFALGHFGPPPTFS